MWSAVQVWLFLLIARKPWEVTSLSWCLTTAACFQLISSSVALLFASSTRILSTSTENVDRVPPVYSSASRSFAHFSNILAACRSRVIVLSLLSQVAMASSNLSFSVRSIFDYCGSSHSPSLHCCLPNERGCCDWHDVCLGLGFSYA